VAVSDKILSFFNLQRTPLPQNQKRRGAKFGYAAGQNNRLNADWRTASVGPNHDLRTALETVRNRARDLVNNDDYAKGYIRQMKANVIGPFGFTPRINPSVRDKSFRENSKKIREKFFEWSESHNCSVNGEDSFIDIQNLMITYAARDGEFALRVVRNKKYKFGFALQVLQVELLDEQFNEVLSDSRVVVLGIEYDRRTWKKTGYWFKDIPLDEQIYGYTTMARARTRIPADEIIYGFDKEYENQSRGISWMVQTMNSMKMLSAYDEATLINARMRAMMAGFIEVDKEAPGNVGNFGDTIDDDGNYVTEMENGIWKVLPKGTKATFADNDFPSAQYPDFVAQNLRRQSVGLGVAGSVHSGNYGDVNFSSERARQIAIRDNYTLIQEWLIRRAMKPIGRIFLQEAYMTGQITYPLAEFERYANILWVGRRWAYVNPEQEWQANQMAWNMGAKSVSQMIIESDSPYEPEEVFQQIADDREMAKNLGFEIVTDIQPPAVPQEVPQAPKKAANGKAGAMVDENGHIITKVSTNGNGVHK
jgi:lambda family phage portal protein